MSTFDQLLTTKTADECKAELYADLASRGVSTTGWRSGGVVRTILAVVSVVLSVLWTLAVAITRGGFRTLAEQTWLTLVVEQVYGVTRRAATFGSGYVVLNNTSGGSSDYASGELIVKNTITNKTYTSTEAFTLDPLEVGKHVAVRADEAGSGSTAAPGQITSFVTTMLGVTCSNPEAVVGQDDETDAELKAKADAKIDSRSLMGPGAAYEYAARTALRTDGSEIGVNRVRVTSNDGVVAVVCATASGGVQESDRSRIDSLLQLYAVAHPATAVAVAATTLAVSLNFDWWVTSEETRSTADMLTAVQAAYSAWLATQPIGGTHLQGVPGGRVYLDSIRSLIRSVSPYTLRVNLVSPAADVEINTYEIPTLGTIVGRVHYEANP